MDGTGAPARVCTSHTTHPARLFNGCSLDAVLISSKGQLAQALEMFASLGNATVGERQAVLAAAARVAQGWDFADALHHALSEGCDDFVTLDADLVRRARRGPTAVPGVVKL